MSRARAHCTLCTRCPTACRSYVCVWLFCCSRFARYCWILVWTKRRFVVSIHALSIFRLLVFLFSLVLCLCEVCWYKFMEWTNESFAENPKEKLLAEFNLTMSHHSNTRAVQTFSEMHTEPRARERMVKKNPNAFHMVEMRKSSSSSCVHKTIEEKVIVSPRLVRHLTA